jgi:hypothetical protein
VTVGLGLHLAELQLPSGVPTKFQPVRNNYMMN